MGRPRILDEIILKKIAKKKGGVNNIAAVGKAVSAKARRLGVSSPVALVLTARDLNIGTATYQSGFNDAQRAEFSSALSTPATSPPRVGNRKSTARAERKIMKVVDYDTNDHFKKGHIDELNRAYTFGCNTSVFILARKIVDNLVIDILKKKYPENVLKNKELYFDTAQGRLKDFEIILKNLKSKKNDFGSENKAVERLYDLAKALKNDANNKTHSWYHLVENKKEIENLNLKMIIEIIKKLEQIVGIR